ncbi:MAG: hypothetical protein PHG12_10580 [Sphaerochaeta sp.]|nr:hypothetical protein [Sphaerochaeta sp.]
MANNITYSYDIPYQATGSMNYIFVKYHHQKILLSKSVWTISQSAELKMFVDSISLKYFDSNYESSYNIIFNNNCLQMIGESPNNDPLFIGKFISKDKAINWHGYPANHIKNRQDIPPDSILTSWKNAGLSTRDIKRIKKGKPIK